MTWSGVLRTLRWPLALLALVLLLWTVRGTLLRQAGDYLDNEDPPLHGDALYVLGGGALERGTQAAQVMAEGRAPEAWFTGENVSTILLAEGIEKRECEQSRGVAVAAGLDPAKAHVLPVGTSTMEEAVAVVDHAARLGHDTILVLSTHFHLRRVGRVFRPLAREKGITVVLCAAPSIHFEKDLWWETEEGMLMVNNEYAKLLYYAWRY